jgi:hypothetical protein
LITKLNTTLMNIGESIRNKVAENRLLIKQLINASNGLMGNIKDLGRETSKLVDRLGYMNESLSRDIAEKTSNLSTQVLIVLVLALSSLIISIIGVVRGGRKT